MDQLEERLVQTIHRYHRRGVDFNVPGMSRGKFILVAAAWQIYSESADHKVRVSELVAKMKIPAPGVSRILRSLEKDDLLQRSADPADRRVTLVTFTEKGLVCIRQCSDVMDSILHQVVQSMGKEKISQLCSLLDELYETSEKAFSDAASGCRESEDV